MLCNPFDISVQNMVKPADNPVPSDLNIFPFNTDACLQISMLHSTYPCLFMYFLFVRISCYICMLYYYWVPVLS